MLRSRLPFRICLAVGLACLFGLACGGGGGGDTSGGGSTATAPAITTQPSAQTVTAGQIATFSAAASGSPAPALQWQRSNDSGGTWSSLSGATASSYSTAATTSADNGAQFRLQASNSAGSATSNGALLTVTPAVTAPAITTQPANQTVNAGQTATFSVAATGTAPLTYVWKRNGTAIAGAASSPSYTTPATTLADSGALFTVVVSNAAGSQTSSAATLTVLAVATGPVITAQPQSLTVAAGQTATFKVTATGTGLTYQWLRSGTAIAGATAATYALTTAAGDSGASFSCAVTADGLSTVSMPALLTVLPLASTPVILTQPLSLAVAVGQSAGFQVAAAGSGTLKFQWSRNGSAIAGATGSSYATPALAAADDYNYYGVTVSNGAGSATSNMAVVRVIPAGTRPFIGQFSASPEAITPGGSATLTWNVAAATSLSLDNGIGTVTGTSVVVKPTTTTSYRLTASNATGTCIGQITVAVDDSISKPVINSFKASPAVCLPGDSVQLGWSVSGAKLLSIDNGVGLVSGASVAVPFTQARTWTLSASNEGGTVTATVSVPQATLLTSATLGAAGGTLASGGFGLTLPSGSLGASSTLDVSSFTAPADHQATVLSLGYVVRGLTSTLGQPVQVTLPVTGSASGTVYVVVRDDAGWSDSTGALGANDRLIAGTIASGRITVTVPVADGSMTNAAAPGGPEPLLGAGGGSTRLSFWAITGNYGYNSSAGNFALTYPVTLINTPCTYLDLADSLEKAYGLITGMGFTRGSNRDWPLQVGVEQIGNEAETGYTFPGFYLQQTYSLQSFNGTVENLACTAGHELFHVFQSYYDPRNRYSKGHGPSDQLWLDEASSVWFQEKMVANPGAYLPEDFAANPHESLIGLRQGMQTGTHGYGSASLVKWLQQEKSTALLEIYQAIQKGTAPVVAIADWASNFTYPFWYDTYLVALMGGNLYSGFDPRWMFSGGSPVLVDRTNISVKIDDEWSADYYSRDITMPPYSARFFVFYPGGVMDTQYWNELDLSAWNDAGDTFYAHAYVLDRATKKVVGSEIWIEDVDYNLLVSKQNWIILMVVNPDDATRPCHVQVYMGTGCMRPGTQVRMAEGPDRAIETLRKGERVLAWDSASGELRPAQIKAVLTHQDKAYETLALSVAGRELHVTGNHPLRTADGRWVKAETLNPGDRILVFNENTGTLAPERIAGIVRDASPEGVVYNLKTSAGNYLAEDVLVHNKCLASGTPVETPQGPRPVETLAVGDEVYGSAQGHRVLTRISHVYQKRTALPALPGRELAPGLRVTDNHPVWTGRGYVPAGELGLPATAIPGAVYDLRTGTGNLFSEGRLLQADD